MFCCLLLNGTRCAGAETGPRWRSLTSTKRTRVSTPCVLPLSLDMRLTQPISLSEVGGWNLICEITQIATLCFRKHFENVAGMSSDDTARTSVPNVLKQFQGEHDPCCVDCEILFFHFNRHATPNDCTFYLVIFMPCSHLFSIFWQFNYNNRFSLLWLMVNKWHVKLSVGVNTSFTQCVIRWRLKLHNHAVRHQHLVVKVFKCEAMV